jgi:hypothetical protein
MVSASDSAPEVPGFSDHLGDRFIVPQPSGSLLEFLYFRTDLAAAPFFEAAVKDRLSRLSNFRHSSYTRVRRFQRGEDRGGVALVSAHVPGRRLAEILQIAARAGLTPPAPAALALARQLMTAVALLHDYGPDIFHGAVTPERLILPGDGRIVICEYVLGSAFEQAVSAWGPAAVWRDCRVPMLADTALGRYGRRADLLQIGLIVLQFMLGRPLSGADYPEGLPRLFDEAFEGATGGWPGPDVRAWLASVLFPERPEAFRTLVEAQKAFGPVVGTCTAGEVSPSNLQGFIDSCEGAAWRQPGEIARPGGPTPTTLMSAAAMLEAVSVRGQAPAVDAAASLAADMLPPAPAQAAEEPVPAADWFTPGRTYLDFEQPDAGDVVPAFPLEAEPGPMLPDLGADPLPVEPATVASPKEPAAVAPPEEPVAEPPEEVAPPEPPPVLDTPVEPPKDAVAPPAPSSQPLAARQAPLPGRKLQNAPRSLSGRRPGRWRTAAIAACAVLLIGVAAFVGPMAWTRVMGGGLPDGRLVVESTPSGGEIVLDGKAAGQTPATLETAAGQHHVEVRIGGSSRAAWVSVPEDGRLVHKVSMPEAAVRGGLHLVTDPPGGMISVDGVDRGKSPAHVLNLPPGSHRVGGIGPFGPVEERDVTVTGGEVTAVTVPTVGWLRIRSPYPLEVSEKGRVFGETSGQAVVVPAGRHHFDLANGALALRVRQFVDVPAGKVVTVPFEAPMGMMNLSSDEPAEVWLDGRPIGQTPLNTLPATLGSHEVVFRHARLGDVSYTVNVTLAAPVRLTVTFNKKQQP